MVHTRPVRSPDRMSNASSVQPKPVTAPARSILIPDPLITHYAHDPLAVGVSVAIARLTQAAKDAVPLAAADLVAWMGSAHE